VHAAFSELAQLEEGWMDWIERLLGVSPDGGDGTSETAIVLAIAIVLAAAIATRVPVIRDALRKRLPGRSTNRR